MEKNTPSKQVHEMEAETLSKEGGDISSMVRKSKVSNFKKEESNASLLGGVEDGPQRPGCDEAVNLEDDEGQPAWKQGNHVEHFNIGARNVGNG